MDSLLDGDDCGATGRGELLGSVDASGEVMSPPVGVIVVCCVVVDARREFKNGRR